MELSKEKILLKSKLFYHYFEPIAEGLSEINYAVIKGEPLSYYAYGDFGKRYFNDIDILVSKEDIKFVRTVLEEYSFVPLSNDRFSRAFCLGFSHQIVPFVKRIGTFSVYIDVNFDVLWGEYLGKQISTKEFLFGTVPMQIHNCYVKTLPHIKFFVQLILHHYKDLNSIYLLATQKTIRLSLFRDLYYYFINNKRYVPLDELLQYCTEMRINDYVYYVLFYTCVLFDNKDLKKYRDAFETNKGRELLNKYGLSEKERREWRVDFIYRLNNGILYDCIKADLSKNEIENIEINKKIFMGV